MMDEGEDRFMPGVGVKVSSEKSIWEIARQDAKEGAEAAEAVAAKAEAEKTSSDAGVGESPLRVSDIVKAYTGAEVENVPVSSVDYIPYTTGRPSQDEAMRVALEEEAYMLDSADTLRKRAESKADPNKSSALILSPDLQP